MNLIEFKVWNKRLNCWLENPVTPYNSVCNIHSEDDLVFCQFTTQKDEAQNKIYVGDILKHTTERSFYYWLVAFEKGGFVIKNICIDGRLLDGIFPFTRNAFYQREKIGNMFENPNLLTGERLPDSDDI